MRVYFFRPLFLASLFFSLLLTPLALRSHEPSPLGALATQHPLATEAGARVLRQGGNAVDAAIAVALTLTVVEPYNSGLGGGGMALVWEAQKKKAHAIDFREKAPLSATQEMYLAPGLLLDASREGPLAIAVPGEVAGLQYIHQKWGKMPWPELFTEAIQHAEQGFSPDPILQERIRKRESCLSRDYHSYQIYRPFLVRPTPGKSPSIFSPFWKQTDLAQTLKRIRDRGAEDFYQGETAKQIAQSIQEKAGILQLQDLQDYRVVERPPLKSRFRWGEVWGMPLPSSGGTLVIHGLKKLEDLKKKQKEDFLKQWPVNLVEVFAKIFQERQTMGDPGNTTHLSVIDAEGNAVSMTLTLNLPFGSCVTAGATGIMMNDEMDDFETRPGEPNAFGLIQGTQNSIAPGKRPLSSMSPTLVTKKKRVILSLGSPGGPRIITSVLQLLARHFLLKESLAEAIRAPRLHFQGEPPMISLEKQVPELWKNQLKLLNIPLASEAPWGNIQAVSLNPKIMTMEALSDSRGQGIGQAVTP